MSTILQGKITSQVVYNLGGFIDRDMNVSSFMSSVSTAPSAGLQQQSSQGNSTGPTGMTGDIGVTVVGPTGPANVGGATGPRGATGGTGVFSPTGPTGTLGMGFTGVAGATWNTGPTGPGMTFLATIQVPSTTATWTTSSFTSISQSFQNLRIIGNFVASNFDSSLQFNTDTGSNYDWELFDANLGGGGPGGTNGVGDTSIPFSNTTYAGPLAPILIDIPAYSSTNNYKTLTYFFGSGGRNGNVGGTVKITHATWRNTAAISSITFFTSTPTIAWISLDLYGY